MYEKDFFWEAEILWRRDVQIDDTLFRIEMKAY